jgi:hypothetical protein
LYSNESSRHSDERFPDDLEAFAVGSENLQPLKRDNLRDSNFKGCYRPDGACGFMVSAYGFGCVSAQDMPRFTAVISFLSPPAPHPCQPLAR